MAQPTMRAQEIDGLTRYAAADLTADGVVRSVNARMAEALGRSAEACEGRLFRELLEPGTQRATADALLRGVTGAAAASSTMRVLEFPGSGGLPVACLMDAVLAARPGADPVVRLREIDVRGRLGSLLVAFRMAAKLGDLGLWIYAADQHRVEWLGGSTALTALVPATEMSVHDLMGRVHRADLPVLHRMLHCPDADSAWARFRFRTDRDGWHHLACQTHRVRVGLDGPERVIGVVRDETEPVTRSRALLATLAGERERGERIAEISSALIAAATEQELQNVVLHRVAAAFGGTGTLLAFTDHDRLRVTSGPGIDARLAQAMNGMPLDAPRPLTYAVRTGTPQFLANREEYAARWPEAHEVLPVTEAVAFSMIPFGAGGRPLGGWIVAYKEEHRPTEEERTLIGALAHLTGQALERIRLQQARIDLSVALQRNMLPAQVRDIGGLRVAARYQPARDGLDVGGDWYDVFPTPGDAVALVIGDAEGHDVDAAAFMGQVRSSIRAFASHEPDPAVVVARTNTLLISMGAQTFASCTLLSFAPRYGVVTACCAGHVPLLWARDDGTHGDLELPGGPVLGVLADAEYADHTFELERGTTLAMVTDGVLEGPDRTLDQGLEIAAGLVGEAQREGLTPDQTANRVMGAAVALGHTDDAAVLVLRRV